MTDPSPRCILVGHANTWHDPAVAVNEDERFFAEGLERHTQCKRAMDMPRLWYSWRALEDYFSRLGDLPVENAEVVHLSSWSGTASTRLLTRPTRNPIAALLAGSTLLEPLFRNQLRWILRGRPPRIFAPPSDGRAGIAPAPGLRCESKTVTHQLAHAANAVYTSEFDDCIVMVVDGYSEGTAISIYHFHDNRFELLHEEDPTVSLGLLYAAVTQYCGFNPYEGEEWKVMGLGAFGEPRDELYRFFDERVTVDGLSVSYRSPEGSGGAFDADAWAELESLAGGFRDPNDADVMPAADLAHNFQRFFEDTMVRLADNASRLGLSDNLALAGGCALNSAANGELVERTGFESLHVPSAPADDGNALGAVLYEKHHERDEPRSTGIMSPYLGSRIDPEDVDRVVELGGVGAERVEDATALCDRVAEMLAAGEIVAWVQGRAEFGPRALGNRSIVADPRSSEIRDRINGRVKFREFYRPLAPSILDEFGPEYFESYQTTPYMERTMTYREEVRDRVPAVVHEDGTGRPQSVRREWNPLFHDLLTAFHRRTGIPLLLNTSFNVMGKPIVHGVEDAVTVLFTTDLDHAVIGRYILSP